MSQVGRTTGEAVDTVCVKIVQQPVVTVAQRVVTVAQRVVMVVQLQLVGLAAATLHHQAGTWVDSNRWVDSNIGHLQLALQLQPI